MKIFGKEQSFEEAFGMSEEEFKRQGEELRALKEDKEAHATRVQAAEQELVSIKDQLKALQTPEPKPSGDARTPTNFYEDPDKAFAERIAPFAEHTLQTNAALQELKARTKFEKEYKLWGKEIDEMIAKHPNMADKGNPALYENIINIVKGKHMDEILEAERKGNSLFVEPASGGSYGSSQETNHGLTNLQLDAAKKMGMDPKEFAENYHAIAEARGMRVGNA